MTRGALAVVLALCLAGCGPANEVVEVTPESDSDVSDGGGLGDGNSSAPSDGDSSAPSDEGAGDDVAGGDTDDDGSASACPADYYLCDDFEVGLDSGQWARLTTDGATIRVSGAAARSGNGGLELALPMADGARAFVQPREIFPLPDNRVHVRFYLSTTPEVAWMHTAILAIAGDLDGRAYYGLHANNGRLNSRYDSTAVTEHGGLRKTGSHELPVDAWMCVELFVDGGSNSMRVWIDGIEDDAMRVTQGGDPRWLAPTFDTLDLGFQTFQATSAPLRVFIDDLAIGPARIGCADEGFLPWGEGAQGSEAR